MNPETSDVRQRLGGLTSQLDQINRDWGRKNYSAVLQFHVDILPDLLDAERCGIFIVDPDGQRVWTKAGTEIGEGDIDVPINGSIAGRCVSSGRSFIVNDASADPDFNDATDNRTGFHTRNLMCAPIVSAGSRGVRGAVEVLNRNSGEQFHESDLAQLERVANVLSIVIDNVLINEQIMTLSNDLTTEVDKLWTGYMSNFALVAESQAMRSLIEMVKAVSTTPVDVHLRGEDGAGKEVIARLLHAASDRHAKYRRESPTGPEENEGQKEQDESS